MGRQLTCITLILSWAWSTHAQQVATTITPTADVGDLGTRVSKSFDISGGTRPSNGLNLFHSFDQFSLGSGDIANFVNDTNLATQNILSRVTGDSPSDIFGTIKTTGFPGADLFLLNPNGIVFEPSAELDVQGSFHASTADFIRLEDGKRFDAAVPLANDALLTAAAPRAFGFLGKHPASMAFQGSKLKVPEGETLSVIGGDIDLTGGAQLQAQGGRVNVASVASAGDVTLNDLRTESFARLGKIDMTQGSRINVNEAKDRRTGGGRILIRSGQLVMDSSEISANTKNGPGKDIDIELTDGLEMEKESSIEARTSGLGTGGSVTVTVKAGRLKLTEGSRIDASTTGAGEGGELLVDAQDILLDGAAVNEETGKFKTSSGLFARNDKKDATGKAGEITVRAGLLRLTRGGVISTIADGPGQGGNIVIEAGKVVLEGIFPGTDKTTGETTVRARSAITADTSGKGPGGHITITASHLRLTKGAQIRVATEGPGHGGNLTINAGEIVLEKTDRSIGDRGRPTIDADSKGKDCDGKACGPGGSITIVAGRLQLKDGAAIRARTFGSGKGGSLSIDADEVILENGFKHLEDGEPTVQESSLTAGEAEVCGGKHCGDGGDITVKADRLQLKQGGAISATTFGSGDSGNITITADEVVLEGRFDSSVREGGFLADITANTRGNGEGGNITINAGRLQLKGDATIRADSGFVNNGKLTVGKGNAGTITIKGKTENRVRSLEVRDEAEIITSTLGDGDAGLIDVTADTIKLVNRGKIASASGSEPDAGKFFVGTGDAGRVSVDAERLEIAGGGSIATTTRGPGRGGTIDVTAADLELRDGASITSESTSVESDPGRSGEIFIRATDSFRLFNDSQVSVKTNQADAGNIDLDVGFLLHLRDSSITTSVAGGEGRGGDINIDPVFTILDRGSRVVAQAREGAGGNIRIFSDFFFKSPDSVVDASSGNPELSGTVEIESPDTDLNAGLIELPADFFDVATLLTQGCAAGADLSRLVVRKYEVLPDSPAALRVPPPGGLLNGDAQDAGFALTRETLGPGFEHSSDCDGDG